MNIKVDLKGTEDIISAIKAVAAKSEKVKREVLATALDIQREAKGRLREYGAIDTGTLRNSIIVETKNNGLTAEIGPTMPYGPYVEFGTRPHFPPMEALEKWAKRHGFDSAWPICKAIAARGLPSRPYLWPALDLYEAKFYERLREIMK